jgi:hypothetical protein
LTIFKRNFHSNIYLPIIDSYTRISKNLSAFQIFKTTVSRIVPSALFV